MIFLPPPPPPLLRYYYRYYIIYTRRRGAQPLYYTRVRTYIVYYYIIIYRTWCVVIIHIYVPFSSADMCLLRRQWFLCGRLYILLYIVLRSKGETDRRRVCVATRARLFPARKTRSGASVISNNGVVRQRK